MALVAILDIIVMPISITLVLNGRINGSLLV